MASKKDGDNIIMITSLDNVLFADLKNSQSCYNYANSLSGTFQYSNLVCSILVNNGNVINNSSAHSWLEYPDSCLIYYKDGRYTVKRILAIDNNELSNVKWAIGGVGLLDMYDPEAEGYCKFDKNGTSYDYSDVLRKTNHTAIGVDSKKKVYGLYLANMTGSEVNDYCQKLGLTHAVMLDGGHIASVNCDAGQINISQKQSNIVQFIMEEDDEIMTDTYKKTVWINETTKLNADNLNHIEDGIESVTNGLIELENSVALKDDISQIQDQINNLSITVKIDGGEIV